MLPVPANTAGDAPSASVVVPATSANLGCAFDCAAIAVTLYLRVSATAIDSGFEIVYRGPDSGEVPRDESNLIVKAMRHCAKQAKRDLPDVRVSVENDIPFGVGLGSSAAAIIAGILLGADLCSMKLEFPAILAMALELEGHPDNIAAAVHGGMVVTAITEEPVRVLVSKAEVAQELDFIAVVPDVPLPTEKARAALPQQYSRKDVVANLQRTALLTAGFFSGRGLSPELFRDRLHQPYRAPAGSGHCRVSGISSPWPGRNFFERCRLGGYGDCSAQRGRDRRCFGLGVSTQKHHGPSAVPQSRQSRRLYFVYLASGAPGFEAHCPPPVFLVKECIRH